ncbi:MAG: translation initiation factor [Halorubrum sp.]
MSNDDSLDDLLDELENHGDLDRIEQELSVTVEERRYGKAMTIVEGFTGSRSEMEALASDLKSSLATGGTTTEVAIELQGDHRDRLPDLLQDMGYSVR